MNDQNFVLINLSTGALVLRGNFDGKILPHPAKSLFQMGNDEAIEYQRLMQNKFPDEEYVIINLFTTNRCKIVTKKVLVDL